MGFLRDFALVTIFFVMLFNIVAAEAGVEGIPLSTDVGDLHVTFFNAINDALSLNVFGAWQNALRLAKQFLELTFRYVFGLPIVLGALGLPEIAVTLITGVVYTIWVLAALQYVAERVL